MNFLNNKFIYKNNIEILGLTQELSAFYILNYFNNNLDNVLIVTDTLYEANKYYSIISTYIKDCYLFPMDDFIISKALATSPEFKINRLETINNINGKKSVVITNLMGLLHFLPSKEEFNKSNLMLKKGDTIKRDTLVQALEDFGYNKDIMVTTTGEYAVRGFIIDLFIIEKEHPIRIEFFGDEIDSIRYFDENTQLSINEISEIKILPFKEVETKNKSSIIDYLNNPFVFFIEREQIISGYKKLLNDILSYHLENNISNEKEMFEIEDLNISKKIYLDRLKSDISESYNYESREIDNFNSNFNLLKEFVKQGLSKNKTIIFYLSNKLEIDNILDLFPNAIITNENNIKSNQINIINLKITKGFEIDNYIIISEYDIEKNLPKEIKYKNTYKIGKRIRNFSDLTIGDYVVHQAHGIGIYNGITTLSKSGIKKDYLTILYAGNDKVYVPVEKISSIFTDESKQSCR